jgi:DNA-binding MarR family transcriptional regulator
VEQSRGEIEQQLHEQLLRIWYRHTAAAALLTESDSALDPVAQLLLRMVIGQGPVRSSELAEQVGLSRPAVSRRVASLESAGLVASVRDPQDGRASLLSATDDGRARIDAITHSGAATVKDLVGDFTTDEIDTLTRLLKRFNDTSTARIATSLTKEAHDQHS